jgi:hypothetical protein
MGRDEFRKWDDNIKMDLKEVLSVGFIWLRIGSSVVNLQVP